MLALHEGLCVIFEVLPHCRFDTILYFALNLLKFRKLLVKLFVDVFLEARDQLLLVFQLLFNLVQRHLGLLVIDALPLVD
jgi:hypothetical protein